MIEGKTKIVYDLPDNHGQVFIQSKDRITAGDGAKSHAMEGKAAISTSTTSSIFNLLNTAGNFQYLMDKNSLQVSLRVATCQGKVREKQNFLQVRELSGNFEKMSGNFGHLTNVREMSGNFVMAIKFF